MKNTKEFTEKHIIEILELMEFFSIDGNCPKCGKQEMADEILTKVGYWDSNFYLVDDELT